MTIMNNFPAGGSSGWGSSTDVSATLLADEWIEQVTENWREYYQDVAIAGMTASVNITVGLDEEQFSGPSPTIYFDAAARAQLCCVSQSNGSIRIQTQSSAAPGIDIPILVRMFA